MDIKGRRSAPATSRCRSSSSRQIFDFTVKPAERERSEEIRSVDVNYRDLVNDIKVGDTVLVDSAYPAGGPLEGRRPHPLPRAHARSLTSRRHINRPREGQSAVFTAKDKADTMSASRRGWTSSRSPLCARRRMWSCCAPSEGTRLTRPHCREDRGPVRHRQPRRHHPGHGRPDGRARRPRIEVPLRELPVIQRRAVRTCLAIGRPVIIATHMLESMISQPMPSRAEITDVANAVYEQADCVMLSGETTVGKYPLECVQVLDSIARRIEEEQAGDFPEPAVFLSDRMKVFAPR